LTARNGQGEVTASTTVTVGGGAIKVISFTSSPEFSTMAGSPVVLTWFTSGATSVNITGNITGSGSGTNLPANGTLTVNPNTNTDYTLTAYGPGGAAVSVTIHVFVR
jgi:hypothetical protein